MPKYRNNYFKRKILFYTFLNSHMSGAFPGIFVEIAFISYGQAAENTVYISILSNAVIILFKNRHFVVHLYLKV